MRLVRERITFCRRDIAKMIATGVEEGVPTRRAGKGPFDWSEIHGIYRGILERVCTPWPDERRRGDRDADEAGTEPSYNCDTYCGSTHDGVVDADVLAWRVRRSRTI